jgi:hypothetical protein
MIKIPYRIDSATINCCAGKKMFNRVLSRHITREFYAYLLALLALAIKRFGHHHTYGG